MPPFAKSGLPRRRFLRHLFLCGLAANLTPITRLAGQPAPRSGTITLLQTTDVHCQVHEHDELFWEQDRAVFRRTGGYARLATLFDRVRRENPHTFIVDTGDMFQGSALSSKTTGQALVPVLNSLGYDLYLPGNWEVIYYKKNLQKLLGALDAPKVCANLHHDAGDGKKGELVFPPYYTWTTLGVKIGFLGYTDPLVPTRQPPAYSKGLVYSKPEESLAHYVGILREQEQCDYVIILAHLGLSQQITLSNLPECAGVDYIFGGDTHERVRTPLQGKYAKVVEPGAFGSFVGRLDLDVRDGKIVADRYELIEVDARRYKPRKDVAQLIDTLEAPHRAAIENVVGYSAVPLYRYFVVENTIDTLLLDAFEWKLRPEGVDVMLSNGFRFCPPRSTPNANGRIPITEGYLFDMLPVDSRVRIGRVTGEQLGKWLEKELHNVFAKDATQRFGGWMVKFRGMQVTFNAFGEPGKRVQSVTIGGKPLDLARTYTISACEREGDPETVLCRINPVQDAHSTSYTLHDVMRDYLAIHSPVRPLPHGDARVLDAPATLLTQVSGVPYAFH